MIKRSGFFGVVFKLFVNNWFHEVKGIHHNITYLGNYLLQLMKQLGKDSTWKRHNSYFHHNFNQPNIGPIFDQFMIVLTKFYLTLISLVGLLSINFDLYYIKIESLGCCQDGNESRHMWNFRVSSNKVYGICKQSGENQNYLTIFQHSVIAC